MAGDSIDSALSMRPRAHNILSYSVTLMVFVAVALLRCSAEGAQVGGNDSLMLASFLWCFHFARRTWESAFVHRYSKPVVPVSDVITEYIYYWVFAAWNAYALTSPNYDVRVGPLTLIGVAIFLIAESCNANSHRMLRNLRAPGSSARVIPRGFLFEWVSSPHYLFEILSWVGFTLVAQTWAALAFLTVGAVILCGWARSRHLAYKKDFDGTGDKELYPQQRRALIPFVF